MARKITPKQKKFAEKYLETGNGTQSALEVYDTVSINTAAQIASDNLIKPNVQAYLESKASKAAEIVFQIAQFGESDDVKLKASKDILDRSGYKAAEKSVTLNIDATSTENTRELGDRLVKLLRRGDKPSV